MNKIIIHQDGNKFYNADMVSFANIDSGGISLHVNNASVGFGRYKNSKRREKAFKMLQEFLSGRFTMPKEEELEYIDDFVFMCPSCNCKNKIAAETLFQKSDYDLKFGAIHRDPNFYCSACGNMFSLCQLTKGR